MEATGFKLEPINWTFILHGVDAHWVGDNHLSEVKNDSNVRSVKRLTNHNPGSFRCLFRFCAHHKNLVDVRENFILVDADLKLAVVVAYSDVSFFAICCLTKDFNVVWAACEYSWEDCWCCDSSLHFHTWNLKCFGLIGSQMGTTISRVARPLMACSISIKVFIMAHMVWVNMNVIPNRLVQVLMVKTALALRSVGQNLSRFTVLRLFLFRASAVVVTMGPWFPFESCALGSARHALFSQAESLEMVCELLIHDLELWLVLEVGDFVLS